MKINNMKLIQSINILQEYMTKRLPQKISYAIMRNFSTLSEEYKFYQKQYQKILEEYKEKIELDDNGDMKFDSNGVPVVSDDKSRNEIYNALSELLRIDIDVNLYLINDEDFNYEDSDRYDVLTPAEIYNLKILLCENKKIE